MIFINRHGKAKENFRLKHADLNEEIIAARCNLETVEGRAHHNELIDRWNNLASAEGCEFSRARYVVLVESPINKALNVNRGMEIKFVEEKP